MGATISGGTAGHIVDLAGLTPSYDDDIERYGMLLGLGIGLVVTAVIDGPDRDHAAEP